MIWKTTRPTRPARISTPDHRAWGEEFMSKDRIAWPVLTLTSGPVDAYPAVLRGLSRPVAYDFDPAFQQFYEDVVKKAKRAMRDDEMPVILHGEPVLGLEAAAASLI